MKLTRTQKIFAAAAFAVLGGVIAYYAVKALMIQGTPIVIIGGSIIGQTCSSDPTGWQPIAGAPNGYQASVAWISGSNIDNLKLTGFDGHPNGVTYQNTGGWQIEYTNRKPDDTQKGNALKVCSNQSCSCAGTPGGLGQVVYISPDSPTASLQSSSSNHKLDFHDNDGSCNQPTQGACDKIYNVTVTRCSDGSDPPYKCSNGKCNVSIGSPACP